MMMKPEDQDFGRYQITEFIGEGRMGAVYKAWDTTLEREVVIKIIPLQATSPANFQELLLQEIRSAARIDHPALVKVYDFGEKPDLIYVVMEFIPGENLGQWMRNLRAKNQWIPRGDAVELIRHLCLPLEYIHQHGLSHRDFRPDNIILKPEPPYRLPYRPVLTDLGLTRLVETDALAGEGDLAGGLAYLSPEQVLGRPVDRRSDVYSLGILLYELAVGRLPFQAETFAEAVRSRTQDSPTPPLAIHPGFPADLQAIILKALEKDPAARYQTIIEMARDLAAYRPEPTPTELAPLAEPEAPRAGAGPVVPLPQARRGTPAPPFPVSRIPQPSPAVGTAPSSQVPSKSPTPAGQTSPYKTLLAYPKLFSRRFSSSVLVFIYPRQLARKVKGALQQQLAAIGKTGSEYQQVEGNTDAEEGKIVQVGIECPGIQFSSPLVGKISAKETKFTFIAKPEDDCQVGAHIARLFFAYKEEGTYIEFFSLAFEIRVVDFVVDHISRPFALNLAAAFSGLGALLMFLLTLLKQVDASFGLASGTAAGLVAVTLFTRFISLFQTLRKSTGTP